VTLNQFGVSSWLLRNAAPSHIPLVLLALASCTQRLVLLVLVLSLRQSSVDGRHLHKLHRLLRVAA